MPSAAKRSTRCSTASTPRRRSWWRAFASSPDDRDTDFCRRRAMIDSSHELRDVCAVVGAGHSRLGQVPGVSSLDLLVEAMRNAIVDAGLKVTDIDGIICRGAD